MRWAPADRPAAGGDPAPVGGHCGADIDDVRSVGQARQRRSGRVGRPEIRLALAESFQIDGLRLDVSSSIGIAVYPEHGADDVSLLLHADGAMYAAKHGGRNRVTVFGED